jgi:CRP/FNR family cyclic AMP-dependent transcriptional regulator
MPLDFFNYDNPGAEVVTDKNAILGDLTDAEWDEFIAQLERRRFPPRAQILRAGDRDRSLYLICSGTVDVVVDTRQGPKKVASIGEGSVFGEMAFFDGAPRSAHVYAKDAVEVASLSVARFEQIAAWRPRLAQKLLMDLGRVLSLRLRRYNQA